VYSLVGAVALGQHLVDHVPNQDSLVLVVDVAYSVAVALALVDSLVVG
jgi:hypothetical protein